MKCCRLRCLLTLVCVSVVCVGLLGTVLLHVAESQYSTSRALLSDNLHTRHLLTASPPTLTHHTQRTVKEKIQTSYIKLEGVDSVGNDLFVVYAASLDQLKSICTALPECGGFNSEGWIKGKVTNKKRAVIDLFLKQTAVVAEEVPQADESAGVFKDRLADYSTMEEKLRIYVYETAVGRDMSSLKDYKYGVEWLFISLLSRSHFRTDDPSKATLFLIPSRCSAYRKSVPSLDQGIQVAADTMAAMVTELKQTHPFWNASLGADHFYICSHDMGTEVAKVADPNLAKNSIALVNTADYSERSFVAHKDVSVPPHPGREAVDWALVGQGGRPFDPLQRTRLAFMAGHSGRGSVRPKVYEMFGSDSDFHLVPGYISNEDYLKALKTTKFCLCLRGNKAWSPRLMDALWFGCIPVVIADHYVLPLHDLIPWHSIAIVIPERQVASLKRILLSISDQRIRRLRTSIQQFYHHLTWNDPPLPFDAFHSSLFSLWQRRHVVRSHTWQLPEEYTEL